MVAGGDVDRGAQRLGFGVVQPAQHAQAGIALAGQQQALGQAQAVAVVQHAGIGCGLFQQPVPQRAGRAFGITAQVAQQAAQQAVAQFCIQPVPQVGVEGVQQRRSQQRRVLGRGLAAELAQPLEGLRRAAGQHHHADGTHQGLGRKQLQMPAVVEADQPLPAGPPGGAGAVVAQQGQKAGPGLRRRGVPGALRQRGGHAAGLQIAQDAAQLGAVEVGAAGRGVVAQKLGQAGDVQRRLQEAQRVEHGLCIRGQRGVEEIGHGWPAV